MKARANRNASDDGFGSRIREAHEFGGGHQLGDPLRDRELEFGGERKNAADLDTGARSLRDARVRVAEDHLAATEPIIDVLVVVDVPEARAAGALDVEGPVVAPVAAVGCDAEGQALEGAFEVEVGSLEGPRHGPQTSSFHLRAFSRAKALPSRIFC